MVGARRGEKAPAVRATQARRLVALNAAPETRRGVAVDVAMWNAHAPRYGSPRQLQVLQALLNEGDEGAAGETVPCAMDVFAMKDS